MDVARTIWYRAKVACIPTCAGLGELIRGSATGRSTGQRWGKSSPVTVLTLLGAVSVRVTGGAGASFEVESVSAPNCSRAWQLVQ